MDLSLLARRCCLNRLLEAIAMSETAAIFPCQVFIILVVLHIVLSFPGRR